MDDGLKKLIDDYQPSRETIKAMSQVSLLATVGPSASGKTTIMRALAASDQQFKVVVGETSRPLRPGETERADMMVRSRDEIIADLKAGNLTQAVIGPSGDLYCTHINNFPRQGIGLFPLVPLGVRQFRSLPLKFFTAAFIVPSDFELWQGWLDRQQQVSGWTAEQRAGRVAEAKTSYEFALNDKEIRFILNDDIQRAARRLAQVGHGRAPDDEDLARQTAEGNYNRLGKIN